MNFKNLSAKFCWGTILFILTLMIGIFFIKVFNKRVDFPCFYLAGERFLQGQPLYFISDEWPYKYLPSAAFFFSPLAWFQYSHALLLFYLLSFFSMLASYGLIFKIWYDKLPAYFTERHLSLTTIATFCLMIKFHSYDFANLQVNHFLIFFLLLTAYFSLAKKSFWASCFLALAGIFKIIPIFLSFHFLVKKNWKLFLTSFSVFFLLLLIPFLRGNFLQTGLQDYLSYRQLMTYYHGLFDHNSIYQSLPATIGRLQNHFQFSEKLNLPLLVLALIPFVFIYFAMIFKSGGKKNAQHFFIEWSMALLFYPLVNPVGWKHGFVFILPAVFIVCDRNLFLTQFKIWHKKTWTFESLSFLIFIILILVPGMIGLGKLKDHLSLTVLALLPLSLSLLSLHKSILPHE